jgi:hypothetical protein
MERVRMHDDQPSNADHQFGVRSLASAAQPSQSARPAAPKRAAVAQDNAEFTREALQLHNELRRKHGVEPLRLNNDLSKLAQQWGKRHENRLLNEPLFFLANHLASTGSLVHSKTKYRNANLGENLYGQSWPMTGASLDVSLVVIRRCSLLIL